MTPVYPQSTFAPNTIDRFRIFTLIVISISGIPAFVPIPKHAVPRSVPDLAIVTVRSPRNGVFRSQRIDMRRPPLLSSNDSNSNPNVKLRAPTINYQPILFSIAMSIAGATLGPFLDSYHSSFGVLRYDSPIVVTTLPLLGGTPAHPALTTAWWVPPLFGLAGFLIGWLYILIDRFVYTADRSDAAADAGNATLPQSRSQHTPSVPKILCGISFFTFQYWFSGILYSYGVDRTAILAIMSVLSCAGFYWFDNTKAGILTSLATAVGGPLIEVGLITGLAGSSGGYHYNDLGETGFFPLWIVPVYFLGGPANGNLARGIWNGLDAVLSPTTTISSESSVTPPEPCPYCRDTRCVPCPNCDDASGYYVTYNREVQCNCCKGRGLVICRSCFGRYDQDPNDLEGIREFMSRMPD